MADINDFKNKDTKFTGTTGQRISTGATGTRVDEAGRLRFNSTTNLMEYYTGVEWKSIDAPPSITNFSVDGRTAATSGFITSDVSGNATVVVVGSLFAAGVTVSFRGAAGANFDATTTTLDSGSQVTAVVPNSSFLSAQEPYSVRVTNLSGLFAQLDSCLSVDSRPVFNSAAGSLGTIGDAGRSSYSLSSAAATDPDGDTITYSISSGALPAGLSLNSSTGAITGTATGVGANTTSSFTVTAATTQQSASRSFSITVNAPVIQSYTSTGGFTFSVPAGITAVRALVIGGGGGGGRVIAGGGGAGGMVVAPAFPVTPGGSVSGNVGGGGGGSGGRGNTGDNGGNSAFGPITAYGGGGGASWDSPPANSGGSGGGGSGNGRGAGGSNQGSFPAVGATGYGNSGTPHGRPGGGGGGAGGGGSGANGGSGRNDDISGSTVTYAGGGGGGGYGDYNGSGGPGGGGPGGPGDGTPGTNNLGAGGGGGYHPPDYNGGNGGSGVVILRY